MNLESIFIVAGVGAFFAIVREYLNTSSIKEKIIKKTEKEITLYNTSPKIPLNKLENYLKENLKDQSLAIKLISNSLLRDSTIWNKGDEKPFVWVFCGPTDSGKRLFYY
jgi:ATP-dependent Clp protease ATP-binding subunit ClpA